MQLSCIGPKCDRQIRARSMCSGHYNQWRKGKELTYIKPIRRRGTGTLDEGYVKLFKPDHPNADNFGKIRKKSYLFMKTKQDKKSVVNALPLYYL